MARFQLTVTDIWSANPVIRPRWPWRQAKQLAECQKRAEVKHFSHQAPPPPANWDWRRGPNSSRNTHILATGWHSSGGGGSGELSVPPGSFVSAEGRKIFGLSH